MIATTLNPTQMHLLKMFSYATSPSALDNIKAALVSYYSEAIDKEMDALWASGVMNDKRQEEFKEAHFRTAYIKK